MTPRLAPMLALFLALTTSTAASAEPAQWQDALVLETASGFVPFANDVPLMLGIGIRAASVHEVWARVGYMPTGDDVGHGFGCLGYRAVLPGYGIVRPVVGGLLAALPSTCGHDAFGRPTCEPEPLFIAAATGGVRLQLQPWFGVGLHASLGVDSYPNPFGMLELASTFALPLQ